MFECPREPCRRLEIFHFVPTNFTVADNAGLLVLRDKPLRLFVFSQDVPTSFLLV